LQGIRKQTHSYLQAVQREGTKGMVRRCGKC